MKVLDQPLDFFWRTNLGLPGLPKKIWGLGAPLTKGHGTPKCSILRVPGPLVGGAPRSKKIFGKSRKSHQVLHKKLSGYSNYFMDFFESNKIDRNLQYYDYTVKIQSACMDSKLKKNSKIFHLVKPLGHKQQEKSLQKCF